MGQRVQKVIWLCIAQKYQLILTMTSFSFIVFRMFDWPSSRWYMHFDVVQVHGWKDFVDALLK